MPSSGPDSLGQQQANSPCSVYGAVSAAPFSAWFQQLKAAGRPSRKPVCMCARACVSVEKKPVRVRQLLTPLTNVGASRARRGRLEQRYDRAANYKRRGKFCRKEFPLTFPREVTPDAHQRRRATPGSRQQPPPAAGSWRARARRGRKVDIAISWFVKASFSQVQGWLAELRTSGCL